MDWFKENLLGIKPEESEPTDLTPEKREQLEKDYLQSVQYDQVDYFHLKGLKTWAKVVRVYDADTVYVVLFLNGKPFKFKIRLAGIDTAELTAKDPREVAWAQKAKAQLIELIGGDLVWLECDKYDKYGRVLANLYHSPGTFSFNETFVEQGLAYRYRGKKRKTFQQWAPKEALGEVMEEQTENGAEEQTENGVEDQTEDQTETKPVTLTPETTPPPGFEEEKPVDNIQDSAVLNETDGPNDYDEKKNAQETMKAKLNLTAKVEDKEVLKPVVKKKRSPRRKKPQKVTEPATDPKKEAQVTDSQTPASQTAPQTAPQTSQTTPQTSQTTPQTITENPEN